ncbi:hypothetical protein [Sulfurimonas sp.]|uniref:hypothetical protein n=1 Tax=Sulfurimonas sp. TaxID=2022749 RepID=UPI00356743B6
MRQIGKILFFNANDGKGIIITSKKDKINFTVQEWDDFDTMPSLGLEVSFNYEDSQAFAIVSLENEDTVSDKQKDEATQEEITKDLSEKTPKLELTNSEPEPEPELTTSDPDPDPDPELETKKYQLESKIDKVNENKDDDFKSKKTENELPNTKIEDSYPEHFESDEHVNIINNFEDIEEEIGPREESVTLTLNLHNAVANYFNIIEENISKRNSYKKVQGRLDYIQIRRFIWTTFNNLSEIDLHIVTPKIKSLKNDLKAMSSVYDDFVKKTRYPQLAYEEVFLACQAEYQKIKNGAQKTIEKLDQLKGSEQHVGTILKVKKNELEKNIKSEEFDILKENFKSLNGSYVDIVHMMAELDERYKHDMELLTNFEQEYRNDFYELFSNAAIKYKVSIVDILSAQTFILDQKLWHEAKASKAVKAHLHKAGISGEFNTKTYLKYYLDSQDSNKMSTDTKKLFNLYKYLSSLEKDNIMIVVNSTEDAMEYTATIKNMHKSYEVKSFIDEKLALKWALKNNVKILIVEDQLSKMQIDIFLKYYKKYIFSIPKIILLGNSKSTDIYTVHRLLSKNSSPRSIAQSISGLIKDK